MKTLHRTIRGARVGVRRTYLECGRKGAHISRFISASGTVLQWSVRGDAIEARKKPGVLNEMQRRIRERAGSWDGNISGEELLRRTRP